MGMSKLSESKMHGQPSGLQKVKKAPSKARTPKKETNGGFNVVMNRKFQGRSNG